MIFLLLDIDGTLTDTCDVDSRAYIKALKTVTGIELTSSDWNSFEHVTDSGITEELFQCKLNRKPLPSDIDDLQMQVLNVLVDEQRRDSSQFSSIDGAKEFLDCMTTRKDVCVGLATGAWRVSAEYKLKSAGINFENLPLRSADDAISRIEITNSCSDDLFERCGEKPSTSYLIGDGLWDMRCAIDLNIEFIGIDSSLNGILKNNGARCVFENFRNPRLEELILNK